MSGMDDAPILKKKNNCTVDLAGAVTDICFCNNKISYKILPQAVDTRENIVALLFNVPMHKKWGNENYLRRTVTQWKQHNQSTMKCSETAIYTSANRIF